MIEISNYRTCKEFDEYGGRGKTDPRSIPIGAFGWLGNPFHIGTDGDRARCIKLFKAYFWQRINQDPAFYHAVLALKGKKIACFCHPKPCHLDVVKAWFDAGCPTSIQMSPIPNERR